MTEQKTNTPDANASELQSFVAATLKAIMGGIGDAQGEVSVRSVYGTGQFEFRPPTEVVFDIAVTAKHTGTARGGMKIQVFSIGANVGGDTSSEAPTVSRMQFAVPTQFRKDRS